MDSKCSTCTFHKTDTCFNKTCHQCTMTGKIRTKMKELEKHCPRWSENTDCENCEFQEQRMCTLKEIYLSHGVKNCRVKVTKESWIK